jgi:Zn-dependent protease with chaperone function
MNFFDAQDRARRSTRWLILIYGIAVVLIVAGVMFLVWAALYMVGEPRTPPDPSVLIAAGVLTALLIVGATLYRTAALSAGGSKVATDMGGTAVTPDVTDPLRRRLRNVVEEMSIASGIPVPDIFVLEAEDGINAFAAGYSPGDAAIAVTRGALEKLNRDELQGVIAHEFSHIMNGDMRINIRMMGVLFGILVVSLIGRMVLRGSLHGRAISGRRNRGAPAVLLIGAGFAILGWIGVLFARIIKAAVSRQRESLADASAVQFTRQTEGLANALKKIGGYPVASYFTAADPEEVSHMLFALGSRRFTSLFATHPPLVERIRALDPSFTADDFAQARDQSAEAQVAGMAFAAAAPASPAATSASGVEASIGNPDAGHIALARRLRESAPASLYDAAHSRDLSILLAVALVLDRNGPHLQRQLGIATEQLGTDRTALVKRFHAELLDAGEAYRLPLLEVALPALKNRPAPQLQYLLSLIRRLIETDGDVDLYEFCFYRILASNLGAAAGPSSAASEPRASKAAVRRAALSLLAIIAAAGHRETAARRDAYMAALAHFGNWAATAGARELPDVAHSVKELDATLDVLARTAMAGRRSLVQAVTTTIEHDRKITLREAELLRAICATLECPLPPLAVETPLERAAASAES